MSMVEEGYVQVKPQYWYYDEVFTHRQLSDIVEVASVLGTPEAPIEKCTGKDTKSWWCNRFDKVPYLKEFREKSILQCKQNFGYDIDPTGSTHFMVNIYSEGSNGYPWHKDTMDMSYRDLKISCIINGSLKPYEGGEFYLAYDTFPEDPLPELERPGNVVMFRSDVLHKVAPITKGERISIVMFYEGPNWR